MFRNNKFNKGRSNLSSRFDLQTSTIGLQGILPLTPYQCRMQNCFQHYWQKDSFRQGVLQILQTVPHHGIRLTNLVPIIRGAPGHNIENCFSFKVDVQRLVKSGMLSFKDTNPNVQANPLPQHKEASVNLTDQHPNVIQIYDIRQIGQNLVKMHAKQAGYGHVPPHNYFTCEICPKNNQGCTVVQAALQEQMDLGWIQHIR